MLPKIRELIVQLERIGFANRGGKGSHRNFHHPFCSRVVRISGNPGSDAKKYHLKQIKEALDEVKK